MQGPQEHLATALVDHSSPQLTRTACRVVLPDAVPAALRTCVLNWGVFSTAAKPEYLRSSELSPPRPPPASPMARAASPEAPRAPSCACASGTDAMLTPAVAAAAPPPLDQFRPSLATLRGSSGTLGAYSLQNGGHDRSTSVELRASSHPCAKTCQSAALLRQSGATIQGSSARPQQRRSAASPKVSRCCLSMLCWACTRYTSTLWHAKAPRQVSNMHISHLQLCAQGIGTHALHARVEYATIGAPAARSTIPSANCSV